MDGITSGFVTIPWFVVLLMAEAHRKSIPLTLPLAGSGGAASASHFGLTIQWKADDGTFPVAFPEAW